MTTKPTLRMDERPIEVAKRHAAAHDTSVSQMVAAYFAALDALAAAAAIESGRVRGVLGATTVTRTGSCTRRRVRRAWTRS